MGNEHNPYTPTPHQVEDSDVMLADQHAHLWADAGTGKTVTALEAFRKGGYKKGIILCPSLAMSMWQEEVERHLGLKAWVIRSNNGRAPKNGSLRSYDFVVTTSRLITNSEAAAARQLAKGKAVGKTLAATLRDFARGGVSPPPTELPRSALILDEAHEYKDATSARTKQVLGVNPTCLCHTVHSVWQLTGTPQTRYADDLFTQLVATNFALLKHYKVHTLELWRQKFCTFKTIQRGRQRVRVVNGSTNLVLLRKILEQAGVIRRRLEDVVDGLPPITYRTVDPGFGNVSNPAVDVESLTRELNDPDSLMATVRRHLGMAKAGGVMDYVTTHANKPCLVGYWHKDVCKELQTYLPVGARVAIVDGSTPHTERDLIRAKFNAGELDILLGQMQAMNTSWNLQDLCKHVVIAEELPSAAMLHQFISRVYRRGQKNHVQIDEMRTTHNLDVAMAALRAKKAEEVEELGL